MKAKIVGFEIEASAFVPMRDIFVEMHKHDTQKIKHWGQDRLVISFFDGKYFSGLLLSTKDQRRFCELKSAATGGLSIKIRNVSKDSDILEFNFFSVNTDNGMGLYQKYPGAASLGIFESIVRDHFGVVFSFITDEMKKQMPRPVKRDVMKAFNDSNLY